MKYQYTHKDHLSDTRLFDIYHQVVQEGQEPYLFYDAGVKNVVGWFEFIKNGNAWFVDVHDEEGQPAGIFWLNGYQGRAAQIHFCSWNANKNKIETVKQAMAWVKAQGHLYSLYGCTPKPFRHVRAFIKAAGFKRIGELPGACYIARIDKYVPGILTVLDLKHM